MLRISERLGLYDSVAFGMGGGTSTTTTTQELSPEQRALIAPVIPIAKQTLANPPKMFPGSGITPFNPLQRQAQQMTIQAANAMQPSLGQLPGEFDKLQGQNDFLSSGRVLRPESNPALAGAIDAATRPVVQNFREQVMPSITQGGVESGGFGGTRQGIAEGLAGRAVNQQVGDIGASMANTNYQAGLQAMLGGLQNQSDLLKNAGGIMSQTLLPAQLRESVGMQQQQMAQAQLSEKVNKFVNEQMIPFSVAQDVASMAFGMPGGTTRSTSNQPGNPMMGMQMAGGVMSMLPMLAGSSDRRLKENVIKVKKLVDGLFIYVFNFIGSTAKMLGLMADEVELVYPTAVSIDSNGYKKVNYLVIPTWVGAY